MTTFVSNSPSSLRDGKPPSMDDLRAFAEDVYRRCLWDAAASAFERLLAAGEPVEEHGSKLVKCLLNLHEPPLPGELARASEVITKMEADGRTDLSVPLREELAAKQPQPKRKLFWRR